MSEQGVTVHVVVHEDYEDTWVVGAFLTAQGAQSYIEAQPDNYERHSLIVVAVPLEA